jgi:hypothetical protein
MVNEFEKAYTTFEKVSGSGVIDSFTMFEQSAGAMGLLFSDFDRVMTKGSKDLALLGGSATNGTKMMSLVGAGSEHLRMQFQKLGVNSAEVSEFQLSYLAQQQQMNRGRTTIDRSLIEATGEYVKDLSGSIAVSYINQLLNYVVYANPFNNREDGMTAQDGFIAGDLIFIPNGLTATLNMDINNNNINWTSLGVTNVAHLNSSTNYVNGYFSCNTITTETNIKRVVKAPLLLRLENLS